MAVPIRQISEIAIVVSDIDRSVRFYHEVLGMRIAERKADHATMQSGQGFIGLWLPGAWELPASDRWAAIRLEGGGRAHFGFWIHNDDAEAALENLKRHNVTYYGPRFHNGEMHLDFEDPDGHMLEYWSRANFEPL